MLTQCSALSPAERLAVRVVTAVFPLWVNSYVAVNLIGWHRAREDPVCQLVSPQPGLPPAPCIQRLAGHIRTGAPEAALHDAAQEIRMRLNPQPAGLLLNAPHPRARPLSGLPPACSDQFPGNRQIIGRAAAATGPCPLLSVHPPMLSQRRR